MYCIHISYRHTIVRNLVECWTLIIPDHPNWKTKNNEVQRTKKWRSSSAPWLQVACPNTSLMIKVNRAKTALSICRLSSNSCCLFPSPCDRFIRRDHATSGSSVSEAVLLFCCLMRPSIRFFEVNEALRAQSISIVGALQVVRCKLHVEGYK